MKNRITLLVCLAIGLLGAQRSFAVHVCLTNSFGEQTQMNLTATGGGNYSVSGSINYGIYGGTIWPISGTYTASTHTLHYVGTNPSPDGCTAWATTVTFDYLRSGLSFSGTFSNDCPNSGSLTASGVLGNCGFMPEVPTGYSATGNSHIGKQQTIELPAGDDIFNALNIQVDPNPALQQAAVHFNVETAGQVKVSIYNQLGQQQIILANEFMQEGSVDYTWNLNDANGVRVKDGMYFVQVETAAGRIQTALMVK